MDQYEEKIDSLEIDGVSYSLFDIYSNELLIDTINSINENNDTIANIINDLNEKLENIENTEESEFVKLLKRLFTEGTVGQLLSKTENGYEWKTINYDEGSSKKQLVLNSPITTIYKNGQAIIEWENIQNANLYIVKTNEEQLVNSNKLILSGFSDTDVYVKAISETNEFVDSDYILSNKVYDESGGESQDTGEYKLFDILWSDMTVTQEVRPVSDGVDPVGVCVIPSEFLGEDEKARFCALKYIDKRESNETTGTLEYVSYLTWGSYGESDSSLKPYYKDDVCLQYNNNSKTTTSAYYYYYKADSSHIPDFGDTTEWKNFIKLNKESNKADNLAINDIDGKQCTEIVVNASNNRQGQLDFKWNLNQYTVSGVDLNDWYLPSCQEMFSFVYYIENGLNNILAKISALYPQKCVSKFEQGEYWTSSVKDNYLAYHGIIETNHNYGLTVKRRDYGCAVVPFLMK